MKKKIKNSRKEKTYRIGLRLFVDNQEYVLAQVGPGKIAAINLEEGNRYRNPEPVKSIYEITYDEMCRIVGNGQDHNEWQTRGVICRPLLKKRLI